MALDLTEFQACLTQPVNDRVAEARATGSKAIGTTCSYIPEPLLEVSGLLPIRLRAPDVVSTPMADTYLSSVLCSYTRSLMEAVLESRMEDLDGWVFAANCDHLRRLYDNLRYLMEPAFSYMLDLPHKTGDEQVAWYMEELRGLAATLTDHFEVDTGPEALAVSIRRHNEVLALLRKLGELRLHDRPLISGTEFHTILMAFRVSPKAPLLPLLRAIIEQVSTAEDAPLPRARLMLVGSTLDDPGYLRVIEGSGARVVADRFCTGSIPGLDAIPEEGEPFESLARHTLRRTACPRMMENFSGRLTEIIQAAERYRVDGVVVETMKFCDMWGVESVPLVKALREAGWPALRVEREYAQAGEGQLQTRIQAFLESLET